MQEKIATAVVFAVAATAGLLTAGYFYSRRRRIPTNWRRVGTLETIYMSPLKSGCTAEQNEVICDVVGLKSPNKLLRDRSFLVVSSSGRFTTARTHPFLTQVKCDVNDDEFVFSFALNEKVRNLNEVIRPLRLKISVVNGKPTNNVEYGWYSDKRLVKVVDCGDEAAEWLNLCVITQDHHNDLSGSERSLRLCYLQDDSFCDDRGLFCDETSYMLITQKSLEDLNTRLNNPVTMRNFRPNFVVSGTSEPYEEDEWKWVRIGDVVFQYIKPCLRCTFTTIDANTGIKDKAQEPLKTLKSYRQIKDPELRRKAGESPVFGAHYGLRSPSGQMVRKGDPVYVNV